MGEIGATFEKSSSVGKVVKGVSRATASLQLLAVLID